MVSDWWRNSDQGDDALMIAKRNAEVAELNALARERAKAAGKLGGEEIEVGGARFAASDQVITRINDQRQNKGSRAATGISFDGALATLSVLLVAVLRGRRGFVWVVGCRTHKS